MDSLLPASEIPATPLTLTLATVSCSLSAQFKAEEWGGKFEPTPEVPLIKSNFAIKTLEGFTLKTQAKKTKKPRKNTKLPFPKKERKRPGNGMCMNSCVSFIVLSKIIPNKHYDIKHFHTGKVQIPGCIRADLSDVKDAITTLINFEKSYFPDVKMVEELYINMINYKFEARQGYCVDLNKLLKILEREQTRAIIAANANNNVTEAEVNTEVKTEVRTKVDNFHVDKVEVVDTADDTDKITFPEHPPITKIKYTPGSSMMYIYFSTPTEKKAGKCIVVSISHNGKCNIQGGTSNLTLTNQIYDFMITVLRIPRLYVKAAIPDSEINDN